MDLSKQVKMGVKMDARIEGIFEEKIMKTTTQALKEYLSLATTEINKGESSLNQMVEKIHFLMKTNGYKISKKTIRESFQWDKLDWDLKAGV
jgi:hypothetical protein